MKYKLTFILLMCYFMSETNQESIVGDLDDGCVTPEDFDAQMSETRTSLQNLEDKLSEVVTQQQHKQHLSELKGKFNETSHQIIQNFNKLEINNLIQTLTEQIETKLSEIRAIVKEEKETIASRVPSNCHEALSATNRNGAYRIFPTILGEESLVCRRAFGAYEGDWTVVARRFDGSVDFYRNWTDYKHGFGNVNGEFFIGLERLHELTSNGNKQELLIIMVDFDDVERYARYDSFKVANEQDHYALSDLGVYTGNATDALRTHANNKFSTSDVNNDQSTKTTCANLYKGAWWYKRCYNSNLFGPHSSQEDAGKVIAWYNMDETTNKQPNIIRTFEILIKPAVE